MCFSKQLYLHFHSLNTFYNHCIAVIYSKQEFEQLACKYPVKSGFLSQLVLQYHLLHYKLYLQINNYKFQCTYVNFYYFSQTQFRPTLFFLHLIMNYISFLFRKLSNSSHYPYYFQSYDYNKCPWKFIYCMMHMTFICTSCTNLYSY